ncbi:diacylglycerol kinase family lipid kinase [Bacteroidales bacterium OttesenSCG-928-M06]|nr:diacylglycerol kinase family lipid kinase [Bacteroidales bacterium OttesenSCG-928-M06]
MKKKKIAFIINPVSGSINKDTIPSLIQQELDLNKFKPNISYTRYAGHATKLAIEYISRNYHCIVAVGGDGTVNEIALALRQTRTALGIIPIGSGNGLARHLGMSLNIRKAIQELNSAKVSKIDYCLLNNMPFFCTSGVGFDAYISQEFGKEKKRGPISYLEKVIKGFFSYQAQTYEIQYDGRKMQTEAFLITAANASQWGNNAHIAPKASIKDGLLDITILKSFPIFFGPHLTFDVFTKNVNDNKYVRTIKTKEILITHPEKEIPFHLDGEPLGQAKEIHIKVIPEGIKILCKHNFQ